MSTNLKSTKSKKVISFLLLAIIMIISICFITMYLHNKNNLKDQKTLAKQQEELSKATEKKQPAEGNTSKASGEDTKQETTNSDKLTSDKATEIISKYIINTNPEAKSRYDHVQTRDGKNYFVIQVYDSLPDHIATIGWYYVEVDTGKAFEWDLAADKLIPIN